MQQSNSSGQFKAVLVALTLLAFILENEVFSWLILLSWAAVGILALLDAMAERGF